MALDRGIFRQAMTENTLRSCHLFTGLPAADIESVASFAVTKHLAKDDYLLREGDPARGFYVCSRAASKCPASTPTGNGSSDEPELTYLG